MSLPLGNEEAVKKEAAKIAAKRLVNEQRKSRILNARTRTIGIDVDALDRQVAESRSRKEMLKEEEKMDKLRAMEIERVLCAAQEEENMMRRYAMDVMKKNWDESLTQKQYDASIIEQPLKPDECGLSAVQRLAGEDRNRVNRVKQQKEQTRKWIQEQLDEKAYMLQQAKNENTSYAEMLKAINLYRDAADKDEQDMHNYLKNTINQENSKLAKMQHDKKYEESRKWLALPLEERIKATSININTDSNESAISPDGKILRKDAFRGYNAEQNRLFLRQNDKIIAENDIIRENERKREYEWAMQQAYVQRALEHAHMSEELLRQEQNAYQNEVLLAQIQDQKNNREQYNKDKHIGFTPKFFEAFGTSAR